ncbi:MAG: LacI family transcriptional regulator [Victivallales bacterium]|jgi:LacI family transcriptional regulator|nr:LacI family transcriptional regulator [Victivallales bacterium]
MSVTIRDIAEALQINPATVSSCLSENYRARRISEKLAMQVRTKAAEMGYIPNRLAGRIFGRNRKKNIALIFKNDTGGSRNLALLDYAIRFLGERNDCDFSVLYSKTSNLHESLKNGIGLGIQDFVVIGYMRGRDFAQSQLEKLPSLRIYACDYYFDDSDQEFPSVVGKIGFYRKEFYRQLKSDYEKSGLAPVKQAYALEIGQKLPDEADPILYNVDEVGDQFKFGKDVIAPVVENMVRQRKCRTLLLRNDAMAIGVIDELLLRGIRIPEELAIIGFNNDAFSEYAKIPLTTVALNLQDAVKELLQNILENRPVQRVLLTTPRLIVRASAPPPLGEEGNQQ